MRGLTAAERALLERIRDAADAPGVVDRCIAREEEQPMRNLVEQGRVHYRTERATSDGEVGGGNISEAGRLALRVHAELVRLGMEAA